MITASLFAMAVSAQATTVVFGNGGTSGFTGGGSQDGPASVGGVTLTVTPWASGPGSASLTVSSDGYGVNSGYRDSDQIDGDDRDEGIILTFSQAVTITNVELRGFSACCDDVDYTVDGVSSNGSNMVGTVFKISADERDSDFRVRSIDFNVSSVPEPATMVTAALGLGLVFLSRFRRQ